MPGNPGATVVTNARAYYSTRAAAGATGTRHSPRPLFGRIVHAQPGRHPRRGMAKVYLAVIASEAKQSIMPKTRNGLLRRIALSYPPLEGEGRREAAGWGEATQRNVSTPPRLIFRCAQYEPTLPLQGGIVTLTQQYATPHSSAASIDSDAGAPALTSFDSSLPHLVSREMREVGALVIQNLYGVVDSQYLAAEVYKAMTSVSKC